MSLLVGDIAAARPHDTALIDERGRLSWGELDARVARVRAAFACAGLGEGSTVVVMAGNRIELFELTVAALESGVLLVPVNWHLVATELRYILDDAAADALVVDQAWVDVAVAAGAPEHSVVIGVEAPAGFETWDHFVATGGDAVDSVPEPVRGGAMFYTSGTTGSPKGVRGSLAVVGGDAAMWQLLAGSSSMFSLSDTDPVYALAGPAYHSAQWVFAVFSLLSGATVTMLQGFDPAELLAVIERDRVTNTFLVPTQFTRLLRLPDEVRTAADTSSLVAVHHGAAPCSPRIKRAMIDWLGPVVWEFYGGTEGGFISMISADEWLERPDSVGRIVPIVEVFITDDEGTRVGPNVTGNLWFRSTMGSSFEYHNAPDKTANAHLEPGVATLGDIGFMDEDGFLYLSDRKIDMIISGGVNIYPAEIEAVLTEHPAVDDAAVFGIPDDEFGESVLAIVEAPGASADLADELLQRCRDDLASYKRPRRIDIVEALPRSEVGKVAKRELREPYWANAERAI